MPATRSSTAGKPRCETQKSRQNAMYQDRHDYYKCNTCGGLFSHYHNSHKRHIQLCEARSQRLRAEEAQAFFLSRVAKSWYCNEEGSLPDVTTSRIYNGTVKNLRIARRTNVGEGGKLRLDQHSLIITQEMRNTVNNLNTVDQRFHRENRNLCPEENRELPFSWGNKLGGVAIGNS
jgi:hypothetical protein